MTKFLSLAAIAITLQLPRAFAGNADQDKADYFYRHGAYQNAATYYENIVKKAPRRKDAVLHGHLGDCYRLMKDPEQAAMWYSRALTAPRKVPKDLKLHYGEVLMMLQKYDTATMMLQQYVATAPNDRRAANMIRGCEAAKAMMEAFPEGLSRPVAINTDRADIGPAIFGNSLVFTTDSMISGAAKKDKWTGQYYFNVYKVTCDKSGNCGTDITQLGGKLNTKYHDGTPAFSSDGQQMYFTRTFTETDGFGGISGVSDQQGTVHLDIMIADNYDAEKKEFKKVHPFPFNDKAYSTTHPALSPDGSMLIFASDMAGGAGAVDLYMSRKNSSGEWQAPVNLGKNINTEGEEMFPVFLDNKTISFASNGQPGLGGLDVFYSTWSDRDQSWGSVVNAGMPVNSSWDDMSLTMYEDGRNGYFASNRPAGKKSDNIYHYLRQKLYLHLRIADSATGKELEGAEVNIQGIRGGQPLMSNGEGYVSGQLYPQAAYRVAIKRKGYSDISTILTTEQLTHPVDTLGGTIRMQSTADIAYSAKILDEASGEPVENPMLVITREGSSHSDTVSLATGISLQKSFEPGTVYHINAVKENYYSDEKVISTKDYRPENGRLVISDTLLMCKLSVGAVCQIENILYDFNKAEIRSDAITSLDKVLKLMREHPTLRLRINSHTDCRGSDAYNMRLSEARANVVIRFLASKGVDMKRLEAKGFGATVPVYNCAGDCGNCPEEGRQKNRRTEFSVLGL